MTSADVQPIDQSYSGENVKSTSNPIMDGVRWTERNSKQIEKIWRYVPKSLRKVLVFLAMFFLASGIQGNWILIVVHFFKHIELNDKNNTLMGTRRGWPDSENGSLLYFITVASIGSYAIFFGFGGFLYWYFYVHQRDKSQEWKCQPKKFPSLEIARHEFLMGSFTLFVLSVLTGVIAWYVANDGSYLKVYYKANEYGWIWFFLQIPVVFVYQDYLTYWTHRFYHLPFFYKHIHKWHHYYKQPTPFSATATHPIEGVHVQLVLASPMVFLPVHWMLFYGILIYTYIHGIIVHSGIAFKAAWWQPWQPDAIFHDNHHQYSHVNYGFNFYFWDTLHGTVRRKNRVYTEDIFSGKGNAFDEVSAEVLANDIAERKSENPIAYRSNKNENELDDKDFES